MTGALILLAVVVVVGVILRLTHRPDPAEPDAPSTEVTEVSHGPFCCGRHAVCEKGLPAVEPVYYDDEELDVFAGRPADEYKDAEIELFRDILLTLRSEDVSGWCESLVSRHIALPEPLRDEVLMIMSE